MSFLLGYTLSLVDEPWLSLIAIDVPVNYGPQVLKMLAQLMRNPSHLAKLHSNLPLHRVLLLFLSGQPKPTVVESTMQFISYLLVASVGDGFGKKRKSFVYL